MDTEVLSYALSKLDKSISMLNKKVAKLSQELEEGQKIKNLCLFTGSIGSLPLKVYVEQHLKDETDSLAKKQQVLEDTKKELQELEELKNNNPSLSALPSFKKKASRSAK